MFDNNREKNNLSSAVISQIFFFYTKNIYKMLLTRKINNLAELGILANVLTIFLKPNLYLILQGELGAGKTTLTQLIAKNLGISEKVTSPTFTILQRHQIKDNYYLNHFDFFRLKI